MNELIAFIEGRLYYASLPTSDRNDSSTFFAQAFGALDFYVMCHPEAEAELHDIWDDYVEKFHAIIKAAD
jgi:hypothetical protein